MCMHIHGIVIGTYGFERSRYCAVAVSIYFPVFDLFTVLGLAPLSGIYSRGPFLYHVFRKMLYICSIKLKH